MTIPVLPERILAGALGCADDARGVSMLVDWWNAERPEAEACHIAAYVPDPEGWWCNTIWDDPTMYALRLFAERRSSARSGNVIVEFRSLRDVDGTWVSCDAGSPDFYIRVGEPETAVQWSERSLRGLREHFQGGGPLPVLQLVDG